jgi:heavy metal efflux system protein
LLTLFILPALYYGLENFIYKRFGHAPSAAEI